MGTAPQENKYTVYPPEIQKDNEELENFFEEQRKVREGTPTPEPEPVAEPTPEPTPEPIPEPLPSPEPEMVAKAELETAEHRYRVLQEKYNAEIPDLHRQVRFLYDQNRMLQQQMEEFKRPTEPVRTKFSLKDSVSMKALEKELAPEVFSNLMGVMEETLHAQQQDFDEKTSRLKGEISTTFVKNKEEVFWDTIYNAYSDYDSIRDDPEFQKFLRQPEGLTGFNKGDFLIDAFRRKDAKTYVRYIDAFTKRSANPNPELHPDKDKLNKKLGAPRPSGGGSPNPTPAKTMTRDQAITEYNRASAEYDRISNELGRGLWDGRESDYNKKEAELVRTINTAAAIINSA